MVRCCSNADTAVYLIALKNCHLQASHTQRLISLLIQFGAFISVSLLQWLSITELSCLSHVLKYLVKVATVPSAAAWLAFLCGWFLYFLNISHSGHLCKVLCSAEFGLTAHEAVLCPFLLYLIGMNHKSLKIHYFSIFTQSDLRIFWARHILYCAVFQSVGKATSWISSYTNTNEEPYWCFQKVR